MLNINQHFADDMRSRVYIETSVISYLTARKGKDAMKAACQQVTLRWWNTRLAAVDPVVSPYVVEEASAGDTRAATARIDVLRTIPLLSIEPEVIVLA